MPKRRTVPRLKRRSEVSPMARSAPSVVVGNGRGNLLQLVGLQVFKHDAGERERRFLEIGCFDKLVSRTQFAVTLIAERHGIW